MTIRRAYEVNGETLVNVKFGGHISGGFFGTAAQSGSNSNYSELGLSIDPIRIIPQINHRDVYVDDLGLQTAAETHAMLSECRVEMTLVHFDLDVLDTCVSEGMGGSAIQEPFQIPGELAGTLAPGGTPMGAGLPLFSSGNHYVSLNILSPQGQYPWRFPSAMLTGPSVEWPLGTRASEVRLSWRALPYTPIRSGASPGQAFYEANSSGRVIFDHNTDT